MLDEQGGNVPAAQLVVQFRGRMRDLRTEVGDPTGAELIRALKNSTGPRLHPSTLSEFANDKRPTSLPGQDFVHAYVRACLRFRRDSPEEIERQVYSWLASRTGIVVALGTSVTPAEEETPQAVEHPAPDLDMICDPAELGAAVSWLVTASGKAPAWLAGRLGMSTGRFDDVLAGHELLTVDQWDELMPLLDVGNGELARWRCAYNRVVHHAGRCAAGNRRRPRALVFRAAAGILVLLLGLGAYLWYVGDDTTSARAELTAEESNPCPPGGRGFTVSNHHSSMMLNNQDRPRMGMRPGVTEIGVRYDVAAPSADHKSCLMTFRHGERCLTAGAGTDVVWQRCGGDLPAQHWIQEPHWHDGTVQWDRLHLARAQELCLQQASSGGVGTPLTLVPCSSDWMQQWRLVRDQ